MLKRMQLQMRNQTSSNFLVGSVVGFFVLMGSQTWAQTPKASPTQPGNEVVSKICSFPKAAKQPPQNEVLFYIRRRYLWRVHSDGTKPMRWMKLPNLPLPRDVLAGPYGRYLYTSGNRWIYRIDPRRKRIRRVVRLRRFPHRMCYSLGLMGLRLLCHGYREGSDFSRTLDIQLPKLPGRKADEKRQVVHDSFDAGKRLSLGKGASFQIFGGRGARGQVRLLCGKQHSAWGSAFYIPQRTKEFGMALSPNGRVLFVGLVLRYEDSGVYGRVYALSKKGKARLITEDDPVELPKHWSFDGHWLIHQRSVTNFEGKTYKLPKYDSITWAKTSSLPSKKTSPSKR